MAHPRIEPLKKVLTIDPTDEVAWFGLGKAYMDDRDYTEAVRALERCIEVKPVYSAAYLALVQSLQQLGRLQHALTICEQGIEVSQKNGDLMVTKQLDALKENLSSGPSQELP